MTDKITEKQRPIKVGAMDYIVVAIICVMMLGTIALIALGIAGVVDIRLDTGSPYADQVINQVLFGTR